GSLRSEGRGNVQSHLEQARPVRCLSDCFVFIFRASYSQLSRLLAVCVQLTGETFFPGPVFCKTHSFMVRPASFNTMFGLTSFTELCKSGNPVLAKLMPTPIP